MKNLTLFFVLLVSSAGQAQVVSGLYGGTLFNDTTKMLQKYEVALSEYRGRITGYSYTTFVSNDTFYYGIRRVTATKKDGNLIIEDDKMLANNFPESPAKKVRRISTIPLIEVGADTVTYLKGRWHTTRTKEYYSVPGSMDLRRDMDSSQSALISHLKELNIIPSGYALTQSESVVVKEAKLKTNKEDKSKAKTEEKTVDKTEPVVVKATETMATSVTAAKTPVANTTFISIPYTQRQEKVLQKMVVASDSLVLSFYDNGVVDGDVISVYLNGQNVIDHAKLKEAAIKKTVPTTLADGELKLVLVAETLGSLPPNTGLLIIQDGSNRYEIRFSADLQTNASIILRRK